MVVSLNELDLEDFVRLALTEIMKETIVWGSSVEFATNAGLVVVGEFVVVILSVGVEISASVVCGLSGGVD